jgi:hypothetical protein
MAKEEGPTIDDLQDLDEVISAPEPKPRSSKSTSSLSSGRKQPLEKRLEGMLALIGDVTSGFDKYDGTVIKDAAPRLAKALVDLANENPRAKRVLEGMLEGGAWAGVGTIVAWEIATPIALRHSMLPEPIQSNLAEIRGVPVKEKKKKGPDLRVVRSDDETTTVVKEEGGTPVMVEARDPATGNLAYFPADGNGRPIFPPPDADE